MNCREANALVHAYADDELDVLTSRQVGEHVESCPACGRALAAARAVKTAAANPALYHRAPALLRAQVFASLPVTSPQRRQTHRSWMTQAIAASVLLVLIGSWLMVNRVGRIDADAQAVLIAHVRSMQLPEHQIDVASSDRHTVKPWIDAKLDYAPPVYQLADQGFPLVGGRLDYLHDRAVAALVYHRGQHVINLFIWPGESGQTEVSRQGYNLRRWSDGGMTFWAVSDVNAADLQHFADAFRAQH
jgi:anti-sigma factor RsiW